MRCVQLAVRHKWTLIDSLHTSFMILRWPKVISDILDSVHLFSSQCLTGLQLVQTRICVSDI